MTKKEKFYVIVKHNEYFSTETYIDGYDMEYKDYLVENISQAKHFEAYGEAIKYLDSEILEESGNVVMIEASYTYN